MFDKSIFCIVATLAPSILIGSSSFFEETRITFNSVVATLAPSFLFGSSLFLEVTRASIKSRMSSNFDQIRPLTAELSALECLKNPYFVL